MPTQLELANLPKERQGDDAEDTSGSEESDASQVESIRGLSDDDKVVILTVFEEQINRGQLLTLKEVRDKMRADLYLRVKVVHTNEVKKIADFVRYKTNFVRQTTLEDLTEADNFEFVASFASGSGLGCQWSSYDTAATERRFGKKPKISNKKIIIQMFEEDQVLAHILRREGSALLREGKEFLQEARDLRKLLQEYFLLL